MLLVTETAPSHRRGFYGAFAQAGVPVGVVLANLAFLISTTATSPEDFAAWAWRMPFLLSIVLVGLGLFVKFRVEDSAAFRAARPAAARRSPIIEALRQHPREIALAAATFLASNLVFYIKITFVLAYENASGLPLSRAEMLTAVLISMGVMFPALFWFGALSDRFGRRRIYIAGAFLMGLWAFALFPLIDTGSLAWTAFALSVGQLFGAAMYGPQAALFAELFDTNVRYSGASLGYQIGSIFGGALAPIIATTLLAKFQDSIAISVYMAVACVVSLTAVAMLKETRGLALQGAAVGTE
jgi:MFS family permease